MGPRWASVLFFLPLACGSSFADEDPDLARSAVAPPLTPTQAGGSQVSLTAFGLGAEQGVGPEPLQVTLPTSAGIVSVSYGKPPPKSPASAPPAGNRPALPDKGPGDVQYIVFGLAGAVLIGAALVKRPARAPPPPTAAEPTPSWQTNYPIVRTLGEGGMGVVYEAVDRGLDRRVAIKKMRDDFRDDPQLRDRFIKEARTVAALRHPAIVDIHSIVEQAGEVYIVFEYVDGKTVEKLIKERGRFALADARRVLGPVCAALQYAHERKVIHRDLKPANVMVTAEGAVKVMDFGLARRGKDAAPAHAPAGANWGLTNTVSGTPLYMPPEAERGILCPEADLYSLGAMSYEMLCGSPPFPPPASASQKETRSYKRLAEVLSGCPPALSALIDDCLEPDPSKRLHTAGDFWRRLTGAA